MNPILQAFFPVADMLAEMFGPFCEVAVHDLSQPDHSVIYVANGSVTGREVGQTFNHLFSHVLTNQNYKNDWVANYMFETPDGKKIKSASSLIRDAKGEVVGMLCINYDISQHLSVQKYLQHFTCTDNLENEAGKALLEDASESSKDVMSVIDQLIFQIVGSEDVSNFSRRKCVEIVKFMDEKGIFLVKGAIDKVAELMGVSRVTIYSYLDEAKGKR